MTKTKAPDVSIIELGELIRFQELAKGFAEVVDGGNLKYIRRYFEQDVQPKWQEDYDCRNISREVNDWVEGVSGVFFSTDIYKELHIPDKKYLSKLLKNLEKEGKIEKSKDRAGKWRKVDDIRHTMDWWTADGELVGMVLPLEIHKQTLIYGQTMIAIAGKWNSGKSGMCLETATMNYGIFNNSIDYILCSEMGPNRFRRRLSSGGVDEDQFRSHVEVFEYRGGHLPDLIRADKLTIIDYITTPEEGAWKIGKILEEINDRMGSGIVVVAMQKPPNRDTAFGKDWTIMVPAIYVALDDGVAKMVKAKEFNEDKVTNPAGKIMPFKIHGGFHFESMDVWHHIDNEDTAKEARRR